MSAADVVVDFPWSVFETHADLDHLTGILRAFPLVWSLRESGRSIGLICGGRLSVATARWIRSPTGTRFVALPPRTLSSHGRRCHRLFLFGWTLLPWTATAYLRTDDPSAGPGTSRHRFGCVGRYFDRQRVRHWMFVKRYGLERRRTWARFLRSSIQFVFQLRMMRRPIRTARIRAAVVQIFGCSIQ